MKIDCTLYLVTDSTPAILGKNHLEDVVRAAVDGGTPVSFFIHVDAMVLNRSTQALLSSNIETSIVIQAI